MKSSEEIIRDYRSVIIQISTPYGSGSGFYVKSANLIVTNRHVISGCNEVAIKGALFPKTIANVVFSDAQHDIAFLNPPQGIDFPDIELETKDVIAGETIIAIGHPLGLKYTATQGIVSKEERIFNSVKYIQIDAAINPGNSGGPLINHDGKLIGINTFIMKDSESLGFAVPVKYLAQDIKDYASTGGEFAIRCMSCSNIITKKNIEGNYCSHCGNKIDETEFEPKPYKPAGVVKTIETIIEKLGKDVRLTRVGQNAWDVEEGSATIKITFNTQNGFIFNDAMLCQLPKENIGRIYEFMLRENYNLEGNSFSVFNQNIILGSVIYRDDLTEESGLELYGRLIKKADHYDDLLINEYGAGRIEEE